MNSKKYISKQKRLTILILAAILTIGLIIGGIKLSEHFEHLYDRSVDGAGTAASRAALSEQDAALVEEYAIAPLPQEPATVEPSLFYNGKAYAYNDDLSVLLIMGVDDEEVTEFDNTKLHDASRSDFLLLAVFDHDKKICTPIQINRDTMTEVPILGYTGTVVGTLYEQIAMAHATGNGLEESCENTVLAVSMLLYNVDIDNYFSLVMNGIPVLNDLVGGVTVTIEDDFTGVDDSFIQGETVTLLGEHAENYVRARKSMTDDATNIARMRRQRTYMTSLFQQLLNRYHEDNSFLVDAYGEISPYMVTDCTIDQLSDYAERFSDYTLQDFVLIDGETVVGEKFMEFYPDEASIQQIVIDTFYEPVD